MQGEKLPCEKVWVDCFMMYEVDDAIDIDINGDGVRKYIIVDVVEDGVVVIDTH